MIESNERRAKKRTNDRIHAVILPKASFKIPRTKSALLDFSGVPRIPLLVRCRHQKRGLRACLSFFSIRAFGRFLIEKLFFSQCYPFSFIIEDQLVTCSADFFSGRLSYNLFSKL